MGGNGALAPRVSGVAVSASRAQGLFMREACLEPGSPKLMTEGISPDCAVGAAGI